MLLAKLSNCCVVLELFTCLGDSVVVMSQIQCSWETSIYFCTYSVIISLAVFGENPMYCHSQLVVCRPLSAVRVVLTPWHLSLKSKCFHLQLWYFICRCDLVSSACHTLFWVIRSKVKVTVTLKKNLTSFHLFKTAPVAERGTRYAVLLLKP